MRKTNVRSIHCKIHLFFAFFIKILTLIDLPVAITDAQLPVSHVTTLPLKHNGDCSLIGVTPDRIIYVEEVYGENGWVAQHALRFDGTSSSRLTSSDGDRRNCSHWPLPPQSSRQNRLADDGAQLRRAAASRDARAGTHARSGAHAEHRGEDGAHRAAPARHPPPHAAGHRRQLRAGRSADRPPGTVFVCRRVRLAIALPEARLDDEGQPYDYETQVIYLAHFYDCERGAALPRLPRRPDRRPALPTDGLPADGRSSVHRRGGDAGRLSAIHVGRSNAPQPLTEAEKLNKKIYG